MSFLSTFVKIFSPLRRGKSKSNIDTNRRLILIVVATPHLEKDCPKMHRGPRLTTAFPSSTEQASVSSLRAKNAVLTRS